MKETFSEQEGILNTFIYIRENPYSLTALRVGILGAKVNKSKNKSKKSKKTRKAKK
jgi:hypothetical protein